MPMGISSSSGSSVQSRLTAAQQQARQAQETAQRLRSEADGAQRSADREQARADGLLQRSQDAWRQFDVAQRSVGAAQFESNNARRAAMPQAPLSTGVFSGTAADYVAGQYLSVMA